MNSLLATKSQRFIPIMLSLMAALLIVVIFIPLAVPLFMGAIFATVTWIFKDFLTQNLKISKKIAQYLAPFLMSLALIVFLGLVSWGIATAYKSSLGSLTQENITSSIEKWKESTFWNFVVQLQNQLGIDNLDAQISSGLQALIGQASKWLGSIFSRLPNFVLDVCIMILAYFGIYFNHQKLIKLRDRQSLMSPKILYRLSNSFIKYSYSTFFTSFVCAFVQGILIGLGAYSVGIKSFIFVMAAAMIAALIPLVGTAPISAAICIYLAFQYGLFSTPVIVMMSFGIVAGLIDNLMRPLLLSGNRNLHPLVAFGAIFGGIALWGASGLFLGPIICGVALDIFDFE